MALSKLTDIRKSLSVEIEDLQVNGITTFTGSVSIGGTLTYQDVTNVDALGIVTARSGINVTGGQLDVGSNIKLGNAGVITATSFVGALPISNDANNRIITATGSGGLNAEANLTFDGSSLDVFDGSNSSTIKLKRHASTASEQAHIGYFSSGLHIETRESTYISLKTNTQERLRIDSSGQVSIGGNSSVGTKVHVENSSGDAHIRLRGSANCGVLYTRHSDGALIGYTGSGNAVNLGSSNLGISASLSGGDIVFQTGGTASSDERARINSSGMMSIGKTGNAGKAIEIYQASFAALRIQNSSTGTGANDGILLEASGSDCLLYNYESATLKLGTAGVERFRIESDGNIRLADTTDNIIHTSHDASRLRLFGGSTESVSNGGVLTLHGVNHSAGNYTDLAAATGGHIQFRVGTSEKMRINSDGIMTRPQQPAFSMQGVTSPSDSSEGYTGILSNYITITECNVGGHYKTSGTDIGNFVAPVNGNYFFVASALLRLRSGSNGSGELTFHKNGSNISARSLGYSMVIGTSDHDNVTISAIISLAAGDKVALVSHACAGGCDWYWGQGLANFSGYLIG